MCTGILACVFSSGSLWNSFSCLILYKSSRSESYAVFNFNDMTPGELSTVRPPLVLTGSTATGTIALNNCTGPEQIGVFLNINLSFRSSGKGEAFLSQLAVHFVGACA